MYSPGVSDLKHSAALKPSAALRSAIRARGRRTGSITYFYSPKNNRDLIFSTELEFCCGLLLEADEQVKNYEVDSELINYHLNSIAYLGDKPNFIIYFHDGSTIYRKTEYLVESKNNIKEEKNKFFADAAGISWDYFTEHQARSNLRIIHDWILISAVLSQTRLSVKSKWNNLSREVVSNIGDGITLGGL
ncbi:hypothetical protein DJFAAGMI_01112 [Comamonas sp. PE63]|uniref:Uncharacterized protein n=1 Tax=Comamonas brasiliensis TaxID=1812482 RepID=A0ABS5LPF6_9BURK|nr:hypothetical protein [Comamonas sp. PE63]MBS3018380.1 hypothetical protein [Comamonas sp. PE63]